MSFDGLKKSLILSSMLLFPCREWVFSINGNEIQQHLIYHQRAVIVELVKRLLGFVFSHNYKIPII